MNKRMLRDKVEAAESRVTEAKGTIEVLLGEIRVLPRAEKMAISKTVEEAFDKLHAAQAELADLERLVDDLTVD
jgi:hypothetical protein